MLNFLNKRLLVLFLICGLIFVLDKTGVFYSVRKAAEIVVVPVQRDIFKIQNSFKVLSFWRSGEERIKNLEQRNWELTGQTAQLEEFKKENIFLRRQLEVEETRLYKKVLAKVIGRDNFLVADKGQEDGVETGKTAVVENILVGVVAKVTPRRAFIRLPTEANSKILGKVGSVRGEVAGQFGISMVLGKVNQNESLAEGEFILTSGEGEVTIPNLVIGKTGKTKSQEAEIFKTAQILPVIGYLKIEELIIIL